MPRSSKWSLSSRFCHKIPACISLLPYMCYLFCSSHSPWFDHPNNIWWSVLIMNLLIIQSSAVSCCFLHLKSKYVPQHPQPTFSNLIHTNTTPEHCTFVYYYFLWHVSVIHLTVIRYRIQVHRGRGKVCYRTDLPFTINLIKYTKYYSQQRINKNIKYSIKCTIKIQSVIKMKLPAVSVYCTAAGEDMTLATGTADATLIRKWKNITTVAQLQPLHFTGDTNEFMYILILVGRWQHKTVSKQHTSSTFTSNTGCSVSHGS